MIESKTTWVALIVVALFLGAGVSYIGFVAPLKTEIAQKDESITNKDDQINQLTETNNELNTEIQKLMDDIASEKQQNIENMAECNAKIQQLNNTIIQMMEQNNMIIEECNYMNETYTYYKSIFENEKVLIYFNKIMVQMPYDYIFYFSGLNDPEPNTDSGILIGSKDYSQDTLSFSWYKSTGMVSLNETLNALYNKISGKVIDRGERKEASLNGYDVLYERHRISSNDQIIFIGFAVWHDPNAGYSLVYAEQRSSGLLDIELLDFVSTYKYNWRD